MGADGGPYTVQAGDTLSGIALQLWGDASLWYKLAQANGLSADSALVEGQSLTVPAGVIRTGNSASTLKPYDPSAAYGETSPTTPKPVPPKVSEHQKNKCGVFGKILLVAVAVAVTALTYGALTGPTTTLLGAIGAGAVSGAAGSIASQSVGVATGIQDQFSSKGVALAGIAGGIGGAIPGGSGLLGKVGGRFTTAAANGAARGVLSNLATQGVAVASGLQGKFDWAGVAVGAWSAGRSPGSGSSSGSSGRARASAHGSAKRAPAQRARSPVPRRAAC